MFWRSRKTTSTCHRAHLEPCDFLYIYVDFTARQIHPVYLFPVSLPCFHMTKQNNKTHPETSASYIWFHWPFGYWFTKFYFLKFIWSSQQKPMYIYPTLQCTFSVTQDEIALSKTFYQLSFKPLPRLLWLSIVQVWNISYISYLHYT